MGRCLRTNLLYSGPYARALSHGEVMGISGANRLYQQDFLRPSSYADASFYYKIPFKAEVLISHLVRSAGTSTLRN